MENKGIPIALHEEMSLDEWVNQTLAPTGDIIYFIISTINRFIDDLKFDRGF